MLARLRKSRGFTLVELMIVVAIVGVLAALAIYGVRKYLMNAKTAEARNALGQMSKDAATAFAKERMAGTVLDFGDNVGAVNRLCTSATAVPAAVPEGTKVQSSPSEWTTGGTLAGWTCLKFSMNSPQYFQYNYTQTGSPSEPGSTFSAIALGDLDGDTQTSEFTLDGEIKDDSGARELVLAPAIAESNPEE